ncbi:hypothetical protein DVH24_020913, partial [Malus domestica]
WRKTNHKHRFDELRHRATLPTRFASVLGEELGGEVLVGDRGTMGREVIMGDGGRGGWVGWEGGYGCGYGEEEDLPNGTNVAATSA